VIELQPAPLAAAPPVVGAKHAAALVTHVYFARDRGRDMASAFHPLYLVGAVEWCCRGPSPADRSPLELRSSSRSQIAGLGTLRMYPNSCLGHLTPASRKVG
jgi:hypothetical protein